MPSVRSGSTDGGLRRSINIPLLWERANRPKTRRFFSPLFFLPHSYFPRFVFIAYGFLFSYKYMSSIIRHEGHAAVCFFFIHFRFLLDFVPRRNNPRPLNKHRVSTTGNARGCFFIFFFYETLICRLYCRCLMQIGLRNGTRSESRPWNSYYKLNRFCI